MINLFLNKFSTESRDSIFYLFFSVIGYGISFVQNFLFAWLVSISFYGEITLVYSIFTLSMAIFMFGFGSAVSRFYFSEDLFNIKSLTTHVSFAWLIISLLIIIIGSMIIYGVFSIFDIEKVSLKNVFLLFFGGFFYSYFELFSTIFPAQQKPFKFGLYLIFNRSVLFLIILLSILLFPNNIDTISYGYFFGGIIIFLAGIISFYKHYEYNISKEKLKLIIKFSSPLAINTIGNLGFSQGFKILISPFISFAELGIFDLASKISNIAYLIGTSVAKGNLATAYKNLEQHKKIESIKYYRNTLIKICIGSNLIIYFSSFIFLYFFKNGAYIPSLKILPFLLVGQSILLVFSYYYVYFTYSNSTRYITISVIIGSLFSLSLAYLFIAVFNWGILGGSLANVFGYLVQYVIIHFYSKISKIHF